MSDLLSTSGTTSYNSSNYYTIRTNQWESNVKTGHFTPCPSGTIHCDSDWHRMDGWMDGWEKHYRRQVSDKPSLGLHTHPGRLLQTVTVQGQ